MNLGMPQSVNLLSLEVNFSNLNLLLMITVNLMIAKPINFSKV